jgi:hypothetical protein
MNVCYDGFQCLLTFNIFCCTGHINMFVIFSLLCLIKTPNNQHNNFFFSYCSETVKCLKIHADLLIHTHKHTHNGLFTLVLYKVIRFTSPFTVFLSLLIGRVHACIYIFTPFKKYAYYA